MTLQFFSLDLQLNFSNDTFNTWTSVLSGLLKAPGLISTNITDMTEPTFILEKWNLALPAIGEVSTILVASHTNQVI